MADLSNVGSLIQNSLLLTNVNNNDKNQAKLKTFQEQLNNLPTVLDKDTLTKLKRRV